MLPKATSTNTQSLSHHQNDLQNLNWRVVSTQTKPELVEESERSCVLNDTGCAWQSAENSCKAMNSKFKTDSCSKRRKCSYMSQLKIHNQTDKRVPGKSIRHGVGKIRPTRGIQIAQRRDEHWSTASDCIPTHASSAIWYCMQH